MLGILTVCAAFPPLACAQSEGFPRVELSAGYSLLPAGGDDFPRPDSTGVLVDVAGNFTRGFGIVGETAWYGGTNSDLGPNFGGATAETTVRQYLIGARFTARREGVNVFAHGLFGASIGDAGAGFEGFSDRGLTFGAGGGVDIHLDGPLSVRTQIDWIGSLADIVEENARISVGIAVGF